MSAQWRSAHFRLADRAAGTPFESSWTYVYAYLWSEWLNAAGLQTPRQVQYGMSRVRKDMGFR